MNNISTPIAFPWEAEESTLTKKRNAKRAEKTGGPTGYYLVSVTNPNQGDKPYIAECGDIIEALKMDFNQGCAFKAIWRTAAAQVLDVVKEGGDAKYDAEKVIFYGGRMLANLTGIKPIKPKTLDTTAVREACADLIATVETMHKELVNCGIYLASSDSLHRQQVERLKTLLKD